MSGRVSVASFRVVVGHPSEVSRRAWHELRYCPDGYVAQLNLVDAVARAMAQRTHARFVRQIR
jgi:hypothetical protein